MSARPAFHPATLVAALAPALVACPPAAAGGIDLIPIGVYETGLFDESAAEIPAYDPLSQRLFIVSADRGVDVLNFADPTAPTLLFTIDAPNTNSVAIDNGRVALAVANADTQLPGSIDLYDTNGVFQQSFNAGALPDMVTFTPDGRFILAANEGEPNDDYDVDPEGSVTIIDTVTNAVTTAGFSAFNAGTPAGVRVFGPGASVAQDLEPEYIAVSQDSATAYVALQENNAIAVVDIASGTVTDLLALGVKDHALHENAIDASNRDDAINIDTHPVQGLLLPDAISIVEQDGRTFILTANEGDARDYDGFSEEARVGDVALDPTAFPDADTLQQDENLGRLKITTTLGDTDGDGDFDELYSYGGRSFSVFEVVDGTSGKEFSLVFDSGSQFEEITADLLADDFNSTNDENDSFDDRSDDKGPEPEGITIGRAFGQTYAFIGLERVGGIMVYNITDPENPLFVTYTNDTRDFSIADVAFGDDTNPLVGDLGPEGLLFIDALDSPTGQDLLVVANEVSGTTRIYAAVYVPSPSAAALGLGAIACLAMRRRVA
jgi:hypothetical protein